MLPYNREKLQQRWWLSSLSRRAAEPYAAFFAAQKLPHTYGLEHSAPNNESGFRPKASSAVWLAAWLVDWLAQINCNQSAKLQLSGGAPRRPRVPGLYGLLSAVVGWAKISHLTITAMTTTTAHLSLYFLRRLRYSTQGNFAFCIRIASHAAKIAV